MAVGVRLVSTDTGHVPSPRDKGWRKACFHTHMTRGSLLPPESHHQIVQWCKANEIDAIGVGSPWTPANEQTYLHYEGVDRELYYSGRIDQRALRQEGEVRGLIEELNRLSAGSTLFYLDNETPKARYGHLWWIGWQYDYPAWHDYDQPFDRWMLEAGPGNFDPEPMPYERRPYLEIAAGQRRGGALGIWAHPTSWWWSDTHAFVTNIATEMPFHLFAEGRLDGMVIMAYRAWQKTYLDLWMKFLDMGYRVPGLAEVDKGLSGENDLQAPCLTWYRSGPERTSVDAIAREVRAGRIIASNGPFIDVTLDGQPMGSHVKTSGGMTHRLVIRAAASGQPCRVQVYTNGGRPATETPSFAGGTLVLEIRSEGTMAWFVCCVIGDAAAGTADVSTPFAAIANPVWIDPDTGSAPAPMRTNMTIDFTHASPWLGGSVSLETAAGDPLDRWTIKEGRLHRTAPAAGRLTLTDADGRQVTRYLLNSNAWVQQLQRSLYRGQFLSDFPGTEPGFVPVEAFKLDECRAALEHITLEF